MTEPDHCTDGGRSAPPPGTATESVCYPGEFRALRESPDLVPAAIEEMLRFDGPAQGPFRTTLEEVSFADITIPKSHRVMLGWASANRDESRFPDGDGECFGVRRDRPGHMGFAVGIHFCLGALLARMESKAAFEVLLRRTDSISLSGNRAWHRPWRDRINVS